VAADAIEAANATLREKGYSTSQLGVHAAPLPGRVLLKGTKIVSPFSDRADTVLRAVERCVPALAELGRATLTPRALRECLAREP
jgi:hypothetical protein